MFSTTEDFFATYIKCILLNINKIVLLKWFCTLRSTDNVCYCKYITNKVYYGFIYCYRVSHWQEISKCFCTVTFNDIEFLKNHNVLKLFIDLSLDSDDKSGRRRNKVFLQTNRNPFKLICISVVCIIVNFKTLCKKLEKSTDVYIIIQNAIRSMLFKF